MNYLAHFALAADRPDWIVGALLGDFVKGPLENCPLRVGVVEGITLHRRIDGFSTLHPAYRRGTRLLDPRWQRFGGIVLDVVFDHFLARRWSHYRDDAIADFAAGVYTILVRERAVLPPPAQRFAHRLVDHDLLCRYAERELIEQVLHSIGQRLRRPVALQCALTELSPTTLRDLEALFDTFYPSVEQFVTAQKRALGTTQNRRRAAP